MEILQLLSRIFSELVIMATFWVLLLLFCTASAVVFECKYSVASWYTLGQRYTCTAKRISSSSVNFVENVTGVHLNGRNSRQVETLFVHNELTLIQLPEGFASFFPDLVALEWFYGSLTSISASDLKAFPKLAALSFAYNKIASLDGNLLQHNTNLQIISFYRNSIESVGSELLQGLTKLVDVRFEANRCINTNAFNKPDIEKLKTELSMKCQPPTTTTTIPVVAPRNGSIVVRVGSCLRYSRIESNQKPFDFTC